MSSKTKIVVFQLKELIYTGIFVVLGILLILLLVFMFTKKDNDASPTGSQYVAGVYKSSLVLNNVPTEIEVVVDANHINSIRFVDLSEAVTTMYPLVQPALDDLSKQICDTQSLENLTYPAESKYTYSVLVDGIKATLDKAKK